MSILNSQDDQTHLRVSSRQRKKHLFHIAAEDIRKLHMVDNICDENKLFLCCILYAIMVETKVCIFIKLN